MANCTIPRVRCSGFHKCSLEAEEKNKNKTEGWENNLSIKQLKSKTMTKEELAAKLNGRDCDNSPFLTEEETEQAKKDGLVVIYGASDDLMEVEGAISDEGDCYDGGELLMDKEGILPDADQAEDDGEDSFEKYVGRKKKAKKIFALWCSEDGFDWAYKTKIPHATFVMPDKRNDAPTYCRGIVFELSELN